MERSFGSQQRIDFGLQADEMFGESAEQTAGFALDEAVVMMFGAVVCKVSSSCLRATSAARRCCATQGPGWSWLEVLAVFGEDGGIQPDPFWPAAP